MGAGLGNGRDNIGTIYALELLQFLLQSYLAVSR
jgi:hypothetical protein